MKIKLSDPRSKSKDKDRLRHWGSDKDIGSKKNGLVIDRDKPRTGICNLDLGWLRVTTLTTYHHSYFQNFSLKMFSLYMEGLIMFSLLPLTYFFPLNSLKSLLLFSFSEASFWIWLGLGLGLALSVKQKDLRRTAVENAYITSFFHWIMHIQCLVFCSDQLEYETFVLKPVQSSFLFSLTEGNIISWWVIVHLVLALSWAKTFWCLGIIP